MIREGFRIVNQAAALLLLAAGCATTADPGAAPDLEARLTLLDRHPKVGGPLRVQLELLNRGSSVYLYDSQQVDVNDSLDVRGPQGRVAYVHGSFQTFGETRELKPGETTTLFESLDVAQQYLVAREGRYAIRFLGRGLSIAKQNPRKPEEEIDLWRSSLRVTSNALEVQVGPGELHELKALLDLLIGVLPAPWQITNPKEQDQGLTLVRSANLKQDVVFAELRLAPEAPEPLAEQVGVFRSKKVWLFSPKESYGRLDEIRPAVKKALH